MGRSRRATVLAGSAALVSALVVGAVIVRLAPEHGAGGWIMLGPPADCQDELATRRMYNNRFCDYAGTRESYLNQARCVPVEDLPAEAAVP